MNETFSDLIIKIFNGKSMSADKRHNNFFSSNLIKVPLIISKKIQISKLLIFL